VTKAVKCRHCEAEVQLETYVDNDGFAQQEGWDTLRFHYDVAHTSIVKKIDRYVEETQQWQ
jgi:hypothetical protein